MLPKFGGKGMYGDRVHEAVIAAGEKESGITIHYTNEHYDEGAIICQVKCPCCRKILLMIWRIVFMRWNMTLIPK